MLQHDLLVHLNTGCRTFLWQRATPITVCWFTSCKWKNNKCYTSWSKLMCNFYTVCTTYKCGNELHNTIWQATGWKPVV